eukprot:TRINITY_DN3184_c0_g1_i1.p1 TRINITY_DN3184_c0_g1~~TRINITY_DN3184_c0_g1_i1.p1  ORF type:complete len:459 (+),score=151.86 TRINITY_DN3184_c0_g1_i1:16-1392(+)
MQSLVTKTANVAAMLPKASPTLQRAYTRLADWKAMPKVVSADEAVRDIKSNDRVFCHMAAAFPQELVWAMANRKEELKNVEVCTCHTDGDAAYTHPDMEGVFRHNAFFTASNSRRAVQEGRADFTPVNLNEAPGLFRQDYLPLDVALLHCSEPDQHGYVSLGTSIVEALGAVEKAKTIIAQVNPNMPRTHGNGKVHVSKITSMVPVDTPVPEVSAGVINETSYKIANHVAEMIPDGACLQMGIGGVPEAVLHKLTGHKNLGIHTEMFSDGVMPLIESGAITNTHKQIEAGHIISTFCLGSKKLYNFVNDNPGISFRCCSFTNDPFVIMQNNNVVSINSSIEVDLMGQCASESIGPLHYSGIGGQNDFVRGAGLSKGGKSIIALPSTTKTGASRIVNFLKTGTAVSVPRPQVRYVATEFGVAELYGKSLRLRAKALIDIAHPNHQEELSKLAFERFGKF